MLDAATSTGNPHNFTYLFFGSKKVTDSKEVSLPPSSPPSPADDYGLPIHGRCRLLSPTELNNTRSMIPFQSIEAINLHTSIAINFSTSTFPMCTHGDVSCECNP